MDNSISPISPGNERAEAYPNEMDDNAHGPYYPPFVTDAVISSSFGQIQAVTVTYTDTYYIYSFDGKLLSEYDQTGSCVRDYIYAGNRLLAEYRPATGKYYYYMSDQINSTRIITDDLGNVVYSEAYGPYGDVQKTWTKTYDPKQKFSGKEREGYSELDYFGARYFDNNSYRFISVDPIINKEGAIGNPQLWNLYAYCANNPITHLDPDGKEIRPGTPDDMPKPPGLNDKWNFKDNPNYDTNDPNNRPGHYIDDEGNRWLWDPDGRNQHGGPHWDVNPQKPGSKKFDNRSKARKRYRPDGSEIKDDKNNVDTLKVVAKGALTIGAGYVAYRIIRFLPSLLPPFWPTVVPNIILP
jgi:RHS repeat-associated protein